MIVLGMRKSRKAVGCAVEDTLRVIGGRWKVMVLYYLVDATRRFNELNRLLAGISARTLAQQLRELERDGVLRRRAYAEIPPRVEYSLTELGRSLKPVLRAMHDWGESWSHRLPRAAS
jgi:DNA-binding HxlR family transcriptional regulator